MEDSLVFVLPDGRAANVAQGPARLIYDRLWDLGMRAGVATAAARIGDALHSSPLFRDDLVFTDRELSPLLQAAKSHPPTWVRLADSGAVDAISLAERRQMVATCLKLTTELASEDEDEKLRALVEELEQLTDRLRAITACELLHDAADRIAAGWSQGAEARNGDGRAVDVLDADAAAWSLLGAVQCAAFASRDAEVEELRIVVSALAELITDPSLQHWNDDPRRRAGDVHTLLTQAEAMTASRGRPGN